MFLIGLTGGIATGKSTVSAIFKDLGVPVVDADVIARKVVEPGRPAWKKIKQEFGSSVIKEDGTINRQVLGQIIFADKSKREVLDGITHPYIQKMILWEIVRHFLGFHQFLILDLPLLFESENMLDYVYKTVVVRCDEEQQQDRLIARNQLSVEDAKNRIKAQMPLEEKCNRASIVIDNSGTENDTMLQVASVYKLLRGSRHHWKLRSFVFGWLFCILATFAWIGYNIFGR